MNKINIKTLSTICLLAFFVLSIAGSVLADPSPVSSNPVNSSETGKTGVSNSSETGPTSNTGVFTLQNPLTKIDSIGALVKSVVEWFSYIAILFAVIMFIYVGFQYVVNAARGDANKIKELHDQLLWLVVGVAVVIGARVIIELVINTLAATGTVSPGVINSSRSALP
ncbi:MAG: hypothetical protein WCT02_02245 [Candidatus Paceibacterota bacterium]